MVFEPLSLISCVSDLISDRRTMPCNGLLRRLGLRRAFRRAACSGPAQGLPPGRSPRLDVAPGREPVGGRRGRPDRARHRRRGGRRPPRAPGAGRRLGGRRGRIRAVHRGRAGRGRPTRDRGPGHLPQGRCRGPRRRRPGGGPRGARPGGLLLPEHGAAGRLAATRTRRRLALVLPRDDAWIRACIAASNLVARLGARPLPTYVHRTHAITEVAERAGLVPAGAHRGRIWQTLVYARP